MARRTTKISTTGKPWARYARLSKAEAAEVRGLSEQQRLEWTNRKLDAQVRRITRWMDEKELPYDDALIFKDPGLSAYKPQVYRPQWEAVMEHARSGELSGIAAVAVDRLTRIVRVGEDIIDLAQTMDVKIGGPDAGLMDLTTHEGITGFRSMVNGGAHYSLSNAFKIKEALEERMEAGKPMGGGRSFGFEVVGDKYAIEVPQRADEVAIVRDLAQRLIAKEEPETLAELAAELNAQNITTTRGGQWTPSNLGRMLSQKRYGGEVEYNGKVVGQMPGKPVLDEETYQAIQDLFASRRRGRRATEPYLLTGVLACSGSDGEQAKRCEGLTMNGGSTFARADGTRPRVYKCSPARGGCGRSIMAEPVEEMVVAEVIALMADPRNAVRIARKTQALNDQRGELEAKVEAIVAQRRKLTDKWSAGDMDDDEYESGLDNIKGRLAKAKAALDTAPAPEEAPEVPGQDPGRARAERLAEAAEDWAGMTAEQKRQTLRQYRVRPVVLPKQPGTRRMDLDRVRFL